MYVTELTDVSTFSMNTHS